MLIATATMRDCPEPTLARHARTALSVQLCLFPMQDGSPEAQLPHMLAAVAALHVFLQANLIG